MLSALRKKKVAKRILIVLAILIIPAFVFWGVGNLGKRRIAGFTYVGFIEGRKISIDSFYNARRGIEIQVLLNYFNQKELLDKILKDRVLINTLTWNHIIMLQEAKKNNIKVSDNEVINFITSHPLFINNGRFDEKFYNYMLQKNLGINTRTFEEEIRQSIKVAKLKNNILSKVDTNEEEVLNLYKTERETGKISYIRIEKDFFKNDIAVDQKDIDTYYENFKHDFMLPEEINLEYIEFPYSSINERDFITKRLNPIAQKLLKGETSLDIIAKEENKVVEETNLFTKDNPPTKFDWDGRIYDILFSMGKGNVRIITNEKQEDLVYLVRIKEKIPSRPMTEKEAFPEIRSLLIEKEADLRAKKQADSIYSLIKSNLSLEKASSTFKLSVDKTDFISRFDYVEGVGEAFDILNNIFNEKPKVCSNPYKTRKGYIIARLDDFKEIDKDAFEKEKEEYRNKVLTFKKQRALEEWLAQISKEANPVVDLRML